MLRNPLTTKSKFNLPLPSLYVWNFFHLFFLKSLERKYQEYLQSKYDLPLVHKGKNPLTTVTCFDSKNSTVHVSGLRFP